MFKIWIFYELLYKYIVKERDNPFPKELTVQLKTILHWLTCIQLQHALIPMTDAHIV